jgi:DNA gyrase subunit A
MTQMQVTFGIILLAIVDNQPKVMNLREMLTRFIDHRKQVIVRRTRYDLRKAEERAHILEGLLKALDILDEIIATIRASASPSEARERLMDDYGFTEPQAQAILDMRLQRLTGIEREKVISEYQELMALIERLRSILGSESLLMEEIRGELMELQETYGDERATEIIAHSHEITIEDLIADEPMVITVTRTGYVKRSPLALYRAQHRGGKGRTGMVTRDEDLVEHLYVASAHSYILVFTESGRVHWLKVHEIPELGPAARGKAIVNLLQLSNTEREATTVAVRDFPEDRFLVFATEKGLIKKTELAAYSNPRAGGINAVTIVDGDRLLAVRVTEGEHHVFLATEKGYSIRFHEDQARPMGRVTQGVRGIRLRKGDKVVGMEVLEGDGDLFTVSELGYGKRTALDEYRVQGRGGKGIINLKVTGKTGAVVGVKQVQDEDGLIMITREGKIIRFPVETVRTIGRSTQGVRLMDIDGDDRIVALAKLVDEEDEEVLAEGEEGTAVDPEAMQTADDDPVSIDDVEAAARDSAAENPDAEDDEEPVN